MGARRSGETSSKNTVELAAVREGPSRCHAEVPGMVTSRRLSWRYLVITVGYMGAIYLLSSLPGSATGPNTPVWRLAGNGFHIPLYAGLGFCLAMTMAHWPWPSRGIGTLAIGLGYAIFDEWHQGFVPGRSASVDDVLLDMAGLALAVGILWGLSRRRPVPPPRGSR